MDCSFDTTPSSRAHPIQQLSASMTTPSTLALCSDNCSNFPGRPNPTSKASVSSRNPLRIRELTAFETVGALIPLPLAITAREAGPFRCTNSKTRRSLIFESNSEATGESVIGHLINSAYKVSIRKWCLEGMRKEVGSRLHIHRDLQRAATPRRRRKCLRSLGRNRPSRRRFLRKKEPLNCRASQL
jgi:hypothetical protein